MNKRWRERAPFLNRSMIGVMPTAAEDPRPSRVLVVDDNRDAAVMLAELLSAYGYEARAAHDAGSALDLGARFRPDLALVDIGLPAVDGYELARRFRLHPVLRKTLLVALTGYGQEQDRRQTAAAGFGGHLVKPVDIDHLRAMLDRLGCPSHRTA
ncbi:MAG TPA: response regulator [Vicinamibacterales bacterium]|jgi:CheY-like chemotaxis protein